MEVLWRNMGAYTSVLTLDGLGRVYFLLDTYKKERCFEDERAYSNYFCGLVLSTVRLLHLPWKL